MNKVCFFHHILQAETGIWWSLFIVFQASSVLLRWWQAAAGVWPQLFMAVQKNSCAIDLLVLRLSRVAGWVNGWVAGMMTWNECDEMNHSRKKSRPTFSTSKSIAHVFIPQSQVVFYSDRSGVSGTTLGGPWEDPGDLMRWSWSMVIHPMHGNPSHGLFKKGHWINGQAKKLMPSLCQAFDSEVWNDLQRPSQL